MPVRNSYYRADAETRPWTLCHWYSGGNSPVAAVLQNRVWNLRQDDRRVRHRKVNCCQSGFESCSRWRQQRRNWITLSFLCVSSFFFPPFTWLASPAVSPRPQARRPVTYPAFYDPDCGLTPSCPRQGHDRQESALKLKSQDSFYLQGVFLSIPTPYSPFSH